MKTILIFILFSISLKAEWKEAFFKQSYDVISIDCVDSNNCYALINSISAKDHEETLIYKTYNQGKDWNEIYRYNPLVDNPMFLFAPWCASVPNGKDYFISYFENGSLKISNDSAKTFRTIDLGTPREVLWINMYDENIGMAFTPINNYITYDGWKTWEERDDFYKVSDPENMVFAPREPEFQSKHFLYLLTANTTNKSRGSCFTTFDMQTKKTSYNYIDSLEYEDGKVPFIQDFSVIDLNTIIAVGEVSSTFGQTSYNLIYKSTDAGKTWVKKHEQLKGLPIGYASGLQKVAFYDKNNGVAVGQWGAICVTNDGGETWKYEDIPKSMEDSPTMKVEWAGRTPIIGTYKGGLYYYNGEFFNSEDEYTIKGRVTENGFPCERLPITYYNENNESDFALTNKEGFYELKVKSKGQIEIEINDRNNFYISDSFFPKKYEFLLNNDTNNINFEVINRDLDAHKRISGYVTLDNKPLPNVEILVDGSKLDAGLIPKVYTDSNGYYVTNFLNSFTLQVWIESEYNGIKYNLNPKYYDIDFSKYEEDIENIDFELSTVTSVNEENSEPLIYPNPANEKITISGIGKSKVEIYNILGQKVIEQDIFGKSEINISSLNGGIYIIKLTQDKETYVDRIIITD